MFLKCWHNNLPQTLGLYLYSTLSSWSFLKLYTLIKGLADVTQISDMDLRTLICNLIYKIMRNRHSDLNKRISNRGLYSRSSTHIYRVLLELLLSFSSGVVQVSKNPTYTPLFLNKHYI